MSLRVDYPVVFFFFCGLSFTRVVDTPASLLCTPFLFLTASAFPSYLIGFTFFQLDSLSFSGHDFLSPPVHRALLFCDGPVFYLIL